jgi:aminoglycoside phosphotransferase (APT) family kinase protein
MFDEQNSDTREVAEQHRFDTCRLEAYLRGKLAGFSGPMTVEQFKGGQFNPTYKLTVASRVIMSPSAAGHCSKLVS